MGKGKYSKGKMLWLGKVKDYQDKKSKRYELYKRFSYEKYTKLYAKHRMNERKRIRLEFNSLAQFCSE